MTRCRHSPTAPQRASHSTALPLDELVHQIRLGGAVVGPDVLLRALEARPDLFRVLDPWRGPWRSAIPREGTRSGIGTRWVVGRGRGAAGTDTAGRLKASLAHLGRTVDDRSVTDLVRWLGMVQEGKRLGRVGLQPTPSA